MFGSVKSIGKIVVVAGGVLAVAILNASTAASDGRIITTEKEFRNLVVDKKQVADWGHLISREDGFITGSYNGKDMTGVWKWEGKYYCRTLSIGSKSLGYDCVEFTISGNKLVYRINKGAKEWVTVTLE